MEEPKFPFESIYPEYSIGRFSNRGGVWFDPTISVYELMQSMNRMDARRLFGDFKLIGSTMGMPCPDQIILKCNVCDTMFLFDLEGRKALECPCCSMGKAEYLKQLYGKSRKALKSDRGRRTEGEIELERINSTNVNYEDVLGPYKRIPGMASGRYTLQCETCGHVRSIAASNLSVRTTPLTCPGCQKE